ncbi:calcium channel flower-like [Culicoides brevitarsis]|uniref:calcium channel flower-like n=1 Tax=Culicoides brevitarsis TaxID=469753 RepID=UPI00307B69DB
MAEKPEKITLTTEKSEENRIKSPSSWLNFNNFLKGIGITGAFLCILFGLWNCLSILFANWICFASGIVQFTLGIFVMGIEAPGCCKFCSCMKVLSSKVEERPSWNRALGYCVSACVPILLCPALASILPCGIVFGYGIFYCCGCKCGKKVNEKHQKMTNEGPENIV